MQGRKKGRKTGRKDGRWSRGMKGRWDIEQW